MLFISLRDFRRAPHFPFLFSSLFWARTRPRTDTYAAEKKKKKAHKRGQAGTPSAHRSLEGSRKSIREPSPFTFISHLFLIPPPFWSFLFPLALPRLLFYQLRERVKSIPNQSAGAGCRSSGDFTGRCPALAGLAQVGRESARACAPTMSGSRVRLVFFPAFSQANTAG